MTIYSPIFEKDGNKFVVPYDGFWSKESEDDARMLGIGALMEAVIYGFSYTFENAIIEDGKLPHVAAEIGPMKVQIIAGPIFDEHSKKEEEDDQPG